MSSIKSVGINLFIIFPYHTFNVHKICSDVSFVTNIENMYLLPFCNSDKLELYQFY